jgi:AcrR family transcriptional regulator
VDRIRAFGRKAIRVSEVDRITAAMNVDNEPKPAQAETTKPKILRAASREFAAKGFASARIDRIAEESACNKAMIYYFFKSKEDLYLAVLEEAYAEMRARESDLDLGTDPPVQALRRLVEFKFDYVGSHPLLIGLLSGENVSGEHYLRRSAPLPYTHSPLIPMLSDLLERGGADGSFRAGIDPIQLYITIASLTYFYFSNAAILAFAYGREMIGEEAHRQRREHAVDVILRYVRP